MSRVAVVVLVAAGLAAVVPAGVGSSPGAGDGGTLVSVRQTGGFAAIERSVTVLRSGEVLVEGRHVATLTRARLATLRRALEGSGWPRLRAHYAPKVHVADGYAYAIAYRGRTVRIDQGATLPPRLAHVFALLRALPR